MKWRSTSRQGRRPFTGWPSRGRYRGSSWAAPGGFVAASWIAGLPHRSPRKRRTRHERPAKRQQPGGLAPRGGCTPMNAVEIEQAITDLAEQPFDPAEFPYAFLEAF